MQWQNSGDNYDMQDADEIAAHEYRMWRKKPCPKHAYGYLDKYYLDVVDEHWNFMGRHWSIGDEKFLDADNGCIYKMTFDMSNYSKEWRGVFLDRV